MPGMNAKHGKTLDRSCVKTAGLPVVPISLLQPTQGEGIRVASSTAAPELVGLILLSTKAPESCLVASAPA
jgi:hypothetical protein